MRAPDKKAGATRRRLPDTTEKDCCDQELECKSEDGSNTTQINHKKTDLIDAGHYCGKKGDFHMLFAIAFIAVFDYIIPALAGD